MIPKELLSEIGKKKGLSNKEHIEKDYFQDVFLYYLSKKTNNFVFKGGTCLYKLYGLNRFSEDLDFSLVEEKADNEVESTIREAVKNADFFKIKSVKNLHDSVLIKISCEGILTGYNTLRIDVSIRNKLLRGFDVKNYVSEYVDIAPFSLRVIKPEEMVAEKIHSLLRRDKARDLYDLFFLLRLSKFDKEIVESKLKIFGMRFSKRMLEEKIRKIGVVWEKELRAFVLGDLPEFDAVRKYVFERI